MICFYFAFILDEIRRSCGFCFLLLFAWIATSPTDMVLPPRLERRARD